MAPAIGKAALTIGLAILLMGLYVLCLVEPGSPEFVALVLALGFDLLFLGGLIWRIRRAARLPLRRVWEDEVTPVVDEEENDEAPLRR